MVRLNRVIHLLPLAASIKSITLKDYAPMDVAATNEVSSFAVRVLVLNAQDITLVETCNHM